MPIRVLDPRTVARIAAGEVVERPASAVKELLENSLDAGARRIDIEIKGGGAALIRVADDGCGIPSDELSLAFTRHATSKIVSFDDLSTLETLGFRGEALASIAAVADIEVTSAVSGAFAGSRLTLGAGHHEKIVPAARACGTTISVTHLFKEVPARLKFLKSDATETGHIVNTVANYAMAYPGIKFRLSVDGREILSTPGSGRLRDVAAEVLGGDIAARMIEAAAAEGLFTVGGLVSPPDASRANRSGMYFFVNRRWIRNSMLSRAVEEAYRGLLTVGRYPVAVVNLVLPPSDIDINIHPAKTEIKFREDGKVFDFVRRAARDALLCGSPVPAIEAQTPAAGETAAPYRPGVFKPSPSADDFFTRAKALSSESGPIFSQALPALRPLGQLAGCYILAEGPDGLYIIDQHAAHERIMYEKVLVERANRSPSSQALLEPQNVELSPAEAGRYPVLTPVLSECGFVTEAFGGRSILVRAIPQALSGGDWRTALREFLNSPESVSRGEERLAELIACHSAVRAGKTLSIDEIRVLLLDLEKAKVPNTCPHGRPTLLKLDSAALERHFKRA
ncbi:DNA mismatch repair protein MutL [Dehalogenimonas alkenigignens]|uniref:DNA mismatch repair protein MutL n=1 Tax=Dehalogenimonas alkenigignens TaxID=1217799 RepID=A0A0W0GKE5_9CHLR|nr:DNA mismatch repair endonuclease MutL [Dehalogenimonas alkenigignens]KTB49037.1 DNA mismatch repair protein MutL [Dehalogenimonas alkenigignens]